MYRLRKNRPERHSRARFKTDPLFEDIPRDKNGRRKLNDIAGEQLVEIANKLIEREKITKARDLTKHDSSLLAEVRVRRLNKKLKFYKEVNEIESIEEVPFIRKARILEIVRKILKTLPDEPPKHPSGRLNWKAWTTDQQFAFAWKLCKNGEIKTAMNLINYNKQLWDRLKRVGLIDDLPFEEPPKERNK
jgi:hypothetical protein